MNTKILKPSSQLTNIHEALNLGIVCGNIIVAFVYFHGWCLFLGCWHIAEIYHGNKRPFRNCWHLDEGREWGLTRFLNLAPSPEHTQSLAHTAVKQVLTSKGGRSVLLVGTIGASLERTPASVKVKSEHRQLFQTYSLSVHHASNQGSSGSSCNQIHP